MSTEESIKNVVNNIAEQLKIEYPCLTFNNGFGYCAYGSELLRQRLNKKNIKCKIIIGRLFKNNTDTDKIKIYLTDQILNFDTTGNDGLVYKEIKDSFIKRGNRLPKITGHAVVLVNNFIYDITSKQFGLEKIYSLNFFRHIWTNVYEAKLIIDEKETFKISNDIKETRLVSNFTKLSYVDW